MRCCDNKNCSLCQQHQRFGESALPQAPEVEWPSGERAVPQQYLQYTRTLSILESILADIEGIPDCLLFAGQCGDAFYLQVGVLGDENYANASASYADKIVYGRRWLIEPWTPTSEVVQTAFLAIKKAREHELREHLYLKSPDVKKATPFNAHHDLPRMADNSTFLRDAAVAWTSTAFAKQRVSTLCEDLLLWKHRFVLQSLVKIHANCWLLELSLYDDALQNHFFPEWYDGKPIVIRLEQGSDTAFLHGLMNELLRMSDRFVDEHFCFQGFARFSESVCPVRVAELSVAARSIQSDSAEFQHAFKEMSCEVDAARAPAFSHGLLGQKQRAAFEQAEQVSGYLPTEGAD